jgi:C-terminal processing protease CtpA/Prc
VARLTLPGTNDPVAVDYIAALQGAITAHERAGACGWIIDLREETGGNMYPMLTGLAPLLGPTPWGGFRDPEGKLSVWTLEADRAVEIPADAFPRTPEAAGPLAPVAVLLGPDTNSAGEAVAIALAGRPNARSFGTATSGFSTGNSSIGLTDGAQLVITTVYEMDRTGRVVHGPVQPDQPTRADQAERAAIVWLAGLGCR